MALFELTGNRLEATALGEPAEDSEREGVLGAVRGQLVDILRRPIFPITWERAGGADVLTALDAARQVTCVELLDRLDAGALVAAMARTAAAARSGWTELAARYPGGSATFMEDWEEFREAVPVNAGTTPRLTFIAMAVDEDVRSALAMLLCSGIEVHEAQVRVTAEGRTLVSLEPVRGDVLGASGALLVARPPREELGDTAQDEEDDAALATTAAVPRVRRGARASRANDADDDAFGTASAGIPLGGATRLRAGASPDRSRGAAVRTATATALAEPDNAGSLELDTGLDDITVPAVRMVEPVGSAGSADTGPEGIDRNHRATAPVLGAQPTVPSGSQAAAALATVASRLDTPVTLVWQRMRRGIHHEAVLSADGIITLSNGMRFRDPSAAANAAQHTQDMDGWRVWRIGAQGPALRDFID